MEIVSEASPAGVQRPFFSVVIATYNRAHLIKRAVESLIAQTEKNWEAIVVDDGSTDATGEVLRPYLQREPKIKYLKKPHSGEALTKNKGVFASTGRFVTFLDSDDAYHPDHLRLRKRVLIENPNAEFLYGGLKIIGNPFVPDRFDTHKKIHLSDCVAGGTFVIERIVLLSLNGFKKIDLGTDADLFERAAEAKIQKIHIDSPTYIYHRDCGDSITNKICAGI